MTNVVHVIIQVLVKKNLKRKIRYKITDLLQDFRNILGFPMPLYGYDSYADLLRSEIGILTLHGVGPDFEIKVPRHFSTDQAATRGLLPPRRPRTSSPLYLHNMDRELCYSPVPSEEDFSPEKHISPSLPTHLRKLEPCSSPASSVVVESKKSYRKEFKKPTAPVLSPSYSALPLQSAAPELQKTSGTVSVTNEIPSATVAPALQAPTAVPTTVPSEHQPSDFPNTPVPAAEPQGSSEDNNLPIYTQAQFDEKMREFMTLLISKTPQMQSLSCPPFQAPVFPSYQTPPFISVPMAPYSGPPPVMPPGSHGPLPFSNIPHPPPSGSSFPFLYPPPASGYGQLNPPPWWGGHPPRY